MSLWSKLKGTIESVWQIGLSGPLWKNNSGNIDARNAADSAFVNVRVATPAGANDAATKAYVDAASPPGATFEIRMAIGTGASQSSVTQIPANAIIFEAQLDITTLYTAGATISLGITGSTTLFMLTGDNNPQGLGIYAVPQDTSVGASAAALLVTVGGAPSAGVGSAIIRYTVPNA